jgi:RNA polymerase sigma-70 factor (ECF subfamily)
MTPVSMEAQDRDDMSRLKAGGDAALNSLMSRHGERLFHYLLRQLNNESDAADIAQETFVRVYQNRARFDLNQKFSTWLYAIATNQAIDALRRQNRHQTVRLNVEGDDENDGSMNRLLVLLENRGPGPLEVLEGNERKQLIRATVETLPDFLKQVVILAYYQGLKYKDIAGILGIPVGTVKSRLHTALCRLHEVWLAEPALKD